MPCDKHMSENQGRTVPRNSKLAPSYIEVILIVLIIVGGAMFGYDRYFAQKIRVVDMGGYLRQQKALMTAGEITSDDFKTGLDKVDQIVSHEAELHRNQVFILKEVVLQNGDEIDIRE